MSSVNERIDKLKTEVSDLRKEVGDLKGNYYTITFNFCLLILMPIFCRNFKTTK